MAGGAKGNGMTQETLVERSRRVLRGTERLEEKKMFGSLGFMINGRLLGSVRESRIMVHVDPALQDDLLMRRGCKPMVMRGKQLRGYLTVDSRALRTDRDLKFWFGLALDYNSGLKARQKAK